MTLTQPYAGLVAAGIKRIENRPRTMIKREDFGKPFAIHASREIDESVYARIREIAPYLAESLVPPSGGRLWGLTRITSAVIGVATIQHVLCGWDEAKIREHRDTLELQLGDQHVADWAEEPTELRDVRALSEPVPCKGALGFWTLPDDIEQRVTAQLGGGSR